MHGPAAILASNERHVTATIGRELNTEPATIRMKNVPVARPHTPKILCPIGVRLAMQSGLASMRGPVDRSRYKRRQRILLRRIELQSEFGAPPQHVGGGPRPLLRHQVAHLRRREFPEP